MTTDFNQGELQFHIGQVVLVPWAHSCAQKTITCPICEGKKFVTLILGTGEHVPMECQGCGTGFREPQGTVNTWAPASGIRELRITGISIENDVFRYQVGFENLKSGDLFTSRVLAESRRAELAIEAEAQAQRDFESQFKSKRNGHGWSVRYHREEIVRLERSLAWHRSKLMMTRPVRVLE